MQCKENIFKFWVERRRQENVRFQPKTGRISENVRDMAKVPINH